MIHQVYVGALILLIFNIQKGNGIMCYSCSSKTNETCINPYRNSLSRVSCNINALEATRLNAKELHESYNKIFEVDPLGFAGIVSLSCLKLVVKDGNKKYVLRGCQLAEQLNLDICRKLEEHNTGVVKMVHCSKCNIDDCNSSPATFNINHVLLTLVCLLCKMYKL